MQQAQDVKDKLRKIEREMSKLRTKQLEMKRDGQPHVSSNSGKTDSIASNNFLKFQSNGRLSHIHLSNIKIPSIPLARLLMKGNPCTSDAF